MQQINTTKPIRLAITAGEPAGIGPDIILQLACQKTWPVELVVIADPLVLQNRAQKLGLTVRIRSYPLAADDQRPLQLGEVLVLPISCPDSVLPDEFNVIVTFRGGPPLPHHPGAPGHEEACQRP